MKAQKEVILNAKEGMQKDKLFLSHEEVPTSDNSASFYSDAPHNLGSFGNSLLPNLCHTQDGPPPMLHDPPFPPHHQYHSNPRFSHGPWLSQNPPFPPDPRFPYGPSFPQNRRPFPLGPHFSQGLPGSQGPPFSQPPSVPRAPFPEHSFQSHSNFAFTSQMPYPSTNIDATNSDVHTDSDFSYNINYAAPNISSNSYDSFKDSNDVILSGSGTETVITKKPVLYSKTTNDSYGSTKPSENISSQIKAEKKVIKGKSSKATQSFRVLVGKIGRKYKNEDIQSILSVIDGFINFDRPQSQHVCKY